MRQKLKRSNPRDHGEHNYKACKLLKDTGGYNDWVITTAFYSALHYVSHRLFPGSYEDLGGNIKKFDSFDSYYYACRVSSSDKHSCRKDLVDDYLEEIASEYSMLKDLCHTARYKNYSHEDEVANKAFDQLREIREFCLNT